MTTYWILDTQATKEITRLNLSVLGKRHTVLGLDEAILSIQSQRYLVFDFDTDAVEIIGLHQGKMGWQGPISSREEAERIAQRLNAANE